MKRFLILTTALMTASPMALADQLYIKNGDRLTGKVMSMIQGDPLVFQAPYGTEIKVAWEHVSAIHDDMGRPISFAVTQCEPLEELAQNVEFKLEQATAKETPIETPSVEKPQDPTAYKWSGRVNAGGNLQDGNNQKKSVSIDGKMQARNDDNRFIVTADANWAQDEGVETENDRQFAFEYDRFVTKQWFIGSRLNLKTDEQAKLDLRSKLGAFTGYQFFESDDLNLLAKLGLDYIKTDYETGKSESDMALNWALDYDQRFYEASFQLFHDHELSVPADETDAFVFESKSGLRVPVGKHLTGTAAVDFDWDNKPAAKVREQDTTYSVKLGYEW